MWTFTPILKTTIWGGERIIPFKGLSTSLSEVGESWEISDVPGSESIVNGGPDDGLSLTALIKRHGASLLGKRNYSKFGDTFPLLIKFIDAAADLSVQVHPDDALAKERGYANGKNEMWYVVSATENARIANGFNRTVDPVELDNLLEQDGIENVLNFMNISPGEVYIIPAGRVHAIGAGAFLIEIQQTSDLTYRLYDYHRKGHDGKERELHVTLAKDAINYADTEGHAVEYINRRNIPVNVAKYPFFTTNILEADTEFIRDYAESDTFVILIAAEGEADITCGNETIRLRKGNTVLIPASASGITIAPQHNIKLIETYIS